MTKKPQPIFVDTVQVLQLIHKALRTRDPARLAAADSVLSGLILHIRHERAAIPQALAEHLDVLTN